MNDKIAGAVESRALFDDAINAIAAAREAAAEVDEAVAAAELRYEEMRRAYAELRGIDAGLKAAVSKWGPRLAKVLGYPSLGAGLAALVADPGAFGGVRDALARIVAVLTGG